MSLFRTLVKTRTLSNEIPPVKSSEIFSETLACKVDACSLDFEEIVEFR
jgi:hypothetical protein